MTNQRVWLFRGIVILVLIIMAVSFLGGAWWNAAIEPSGPEEGVWIYPYAFVTQVEGMAAQYIVAVEVPSFINWVPWVYVAFVVLAIIYCLWKYNSKFSRIILGLIGFSYIVYPAFFAFYAKMRMAEFDIPWTGREMVIGDPIGIYVTGFVNWNYYLAYVAGILFIIVAIFAKKIIGANKNNQ
ncbi:MAG: hypothetical protein ACOWWR_10720 [Eubacteriales bacterium]